MWVPDMKYRVMQELNYRYYGDSLEAAVEQFNHFASHAIIEEDIHEITREPLLQALDPDDNNLLGVLYGATKEEYDNVSEPDPFAHP